MRKGGASAVEPTGRFPFGRCESVRGRSSQIFRLVFFSVRVAVFDGCMG